MKALAIISTLLTLLFVFLWFSEKSDAEKAREEKAAAEAREDAAVQAQGELDQKFKDASAKVGYQSGAYTDPALIDAAAITGGIASNAVLKVPKEFWKSAEGEGVTETTLDLKKFPPELLAKLQQIAGMIPRDAPFPPDENAPEEEKQAYAAKKAEWDQKFKEYETAFEEVFKAPEFAEFKAAIGPASNFVLSKEGEILEVAFYRAPTGAPTLEEILKDPGPAIGRMRTAFEQNMANLISQVQAMRKELAEKEKALTNPDEAALGMREQLQREQAAHTADVTRLQGELQDATTKAEQFRVEASTAQQALAALKDESSREKRTLEQKIAALTEFQRTTKEKMDLEIRRNDPDGQILDASVTLGTAYIDLGTVDRVFPGLKFEVYGVGRGGIRELKGVVLVQKALDAHYSQVSILRIENESRPIVRGDTVHNPFYNPTKPVHVFLAGELQKYPKSVAAARLRRANVVIDETLGADTDYVVVPDTVRVPVEAAAPAEDGAEPAPAAVTASEYDRWRERARTFGATLITERQLEAFLDY